MFSNTRYAGCVRISQNLKTECDEYQNINGIRVDNETVASLSENDYSQ